MLKIESLFNEIKKKIESASKILKAIGYNIYKISPLEFYEYVSGETPTGDKVMLDEILANEYFMMHEIVEICELKKMKIPIDKDTVIKYHPIVYRAHLTAAEWELKYALERKDFKWIRKRLKHAREWLNDKLLPIQLLPKCKSLIDKFSNVSL
ncbi:MAG: hypothetical protein DRJ44_04815 [Thermoprotei archaeon]|nr:MAG: hypothetical protein DRJ44_04815 [Thermoprotei archaeon]